MKSCKWSHITLCLLLVFFVNPKESYCQNSDNWINNFQLRDRNTVEDLNTQLNDLDIQIFQSVNTFNNDTILKLIDDKPFIAGQIVNRVQQKTTCLKNVSEIYAKYISGSKIYLDSLDEYKANAEISLSLIEDNKNELQNLQLNDDSDTILYTKGLIERIKIEETIVIFQKQFFTFFALKNKTDLINAADDQSTISDQPVLSTTEPVNNSGEFEYANVIVNEEIVESIKVSISNYKEDTNQSIYNITNFDIDNLNRIWGEYLYNDTVITSNTNVESSSKQSIPNEHIDSSGYSINETTTSVMADNSDTKIAQQTNYVQESTLDVGQTEKKSMEYNPPAESPVLSENKISSDLVFRVQIAADNVPLSDKKLKKRYKGNRPIMMFQEEGWYKYYIAETVTLKEAIIIKKESGVSDAFVMAYKNGKKVKYYLKYVKPDEGSEPPGNFIDLASLSKHKVVIVVQVAADREPLSEERLSELYQGGKPLNYIFEDGWHKYSFGNFTKFWPANMARRKCGVKDAFVVAYKDGKKHDLWKNYDKKE